MGNKLLLTGTLLVAFIGGALFQGITKIGTTKAASAEEVAAPMQFAAPASQVTYRAAAPAPTRIVEREVIVQERPVVQRKRSWERSVLIVAGSSGAGAAIGAVAGGGKGAGIGAVSGGVAGVIYDMATRNK